MKNEKTNNEKSFAEQLAEAMRRVPDDKKEIVAAHLLGTVQGVLISSDMQRDS